jgi:2-polyprenyl-3-methyl-5-hydroxy-6-metoxy-1,4-benzoquinol methylase
LNINQQHKLIDTNNDTARLVNDRANHLYQKLAVLDISDTDIDESGKYYFNAHHTGNRLFFSIQSSADIIYQSVKKTNKPIAELSFIDYGAGLGTLFLLAGLVGFKKVYFNDYFPQWAGYAKTICDKLDTSIDDYISGDIDAVIAYAKANHVHFDIVASRNVVEHIYKLRDFYTKLSQSGITGLCYATTTANFHNPAMRLKHYWYHYKTEKNLFIKQRADHIRQLVPAVNASDLKQLIELTRGRAFADFTNAIDLYFKKQPICNVEFLRTNTCDCTTGVWAENLITRSNYTDIIQQAGFKAEYTAGFWDTHYKSKIVNLITGILNRIIKITGKKGYWFAPFVNITAAKN